MELKYIKCGDYYIQNLKLPEVPALGKYGRMRNRFLRDHHEGIYTAMLLTGKLFEHLTEVDRSASEMMERLVPQMAKTEGVTEALKASDQMAWVGHMNSIRNRAEEIVLHDLIYT